VLFSFEALLAQRPFSGGEPGTVVKASLLAVIWLYATGPDGKQLIPIDPLALAADINANGSLFLWSNQQTRRP
jgi:hypothetical protein